MADWRVCATDDGVGRGFLAGGPFTRCIQSHSPEVLISLNISMLAPSFQGLWLLRIRSNQLIQEWRQASGRQEQTEPPSRGRVRTPFKGRSSRYQITGVNQGHDFAFGQRLRLRARTATAAGGAGEAAGVDPHEGLRVVVLFEGRDAAGKGGAIKRIADSLNPRVCRIVCAGDADRARENAVVFPEVCGASAGGGRDGAVRPKLV
jgi:hypothetical protein